MPVNAGELSLIAQSSLARLLTGRLERSTDEVRAHLAFLERTLPLDIQQKIVTEFGGLLQPDD